MLTDEQRRAFDEEGLLRLPGAVARAEAERMAERIHACLATEEVVRRNSENEWLRTRPGGLGQLKKDGTFDAVRESDVPVALDELFGADGWKRTRSWGNPAVTYTTDNEWELPTTGWHVDIAPDQLGRSRSVTVFTVLTELRPRGGGTLIVTGSHRLVRRFGQSDVHNRAQRRILGAIHPWLADLWGRQPLPDRRQRYVDRGTVIEGVPVQVVELTGQPGDAFLMRGDTFHNVAPNALPEPRTMLIKGIPLVLP